MNEAEEHSGSASPTGGPALYDVTLSEEFRQVSDRYCK